MHIEKRKKGGTVEVKEESWRDLEVIKRLETCARQLYFSMR